ncbi:MAG: hypothetical protein H7Z11_02700 [Verrucomicrobia bacterium]|nr:hypothetical protein [Leptolyngbya sp. ES-bin-22]
MASLTGALGDRPYSTQETAPFTRGLCFGTVFATTFVLRQYRRLPQGDR